MLKKSNFACNNLMKFGIPSCYLIVGQGRSILAPENYGAAGSMQRGRLVC